MKKQSKYNKWMRGVFFIPLLAIVTSIANAENENKNLPELIIPVDTSVAHEVISNMDISQKDLLHFTKRFRIVMIDPSLLDGSVDEFVITPFPKKPITVRTDSIDLTYPLRPSWRGHSVYGMEKSKID